jgi:hypothetical protein
MRNAQTKGRVNQPIIRDQRSPNLRTQQQRSQRALLLEILPETPTRG